MTEQHSNLEPQGRDEHPADEPLDLDGPPIIGSLELDDATLSVSVSAVDVGLSLYNIGVGGEDVSASTTVDVSLSPSHARKVGDWLNSAADLTDAEEIARVKQRQERQRARREAEATDSERRRSRIASRTVDPGAVHRVYNAVESLAGDGPIGYRLHNAVLTLWPLEPDDFPPGPQRDVFEQVRADLAKLSSVSAEGHIATLDVDTEQGVAVARRIVRLAYAVACGQIGQ